MALLERRAMAWVVRPLLTLMATVAAALAVCSSVGCSEKQLFLSFPRPSSKKVEKVVKKLHANFPGAMKGLAVQNKYLITVKPYGLTRGNTVYAQCICSDEINGDKGHLTTLLTKYYRRHFNMGGLGGFPYTGKTGFGAFTNHTPAEGHVLICFGPHIGFSPDGEPAKFLRDGQAKCSPACGALCAAYAQLSSDADLPEDPMDREQGQLRSKLKKHITAVSMSSEPMIALVKKAYDVVEEEMLGLVHTDYVPGHLVLLGGIQVNMPYPLPGYFVPQHFSVRSKTLPPTDLMAAFK